MWFESVSSVSGIVVMGLFLRFSGSTHGETPFVFGSQKCVQQRVLRIAYLHGKNRLQS